MVRARQPGGIPRAVVRLIAGISLCDALLIAAGGSPGAAALAALAFPVTLFLQRYVSGT
jgi:4-hydroxybenzoate polyprenyltransferase